MLSPSAGLGRTGSSEESASDALADLPGWQTEAAGRGPLRTSPRRSRARPLLPRRCPRSWNLLTHGLTGVAMGAEPAEPGAMSRPPQPPAQSVLGDGLWQRILRISLVIAAIALAVGIWGHHTHRGWQSMLFLALTSLELGVALGLRSKLWTRQNLFLPAVVAGSLLLALAGLYVSALGDLLGTVSLPVWDSPGSVRNSVQRRDQPGPPPAGGGRKGSRMDNTTTSTVDPPVVTPESDEELAEQLVERARAGGLELTGPNGLLTGLTRRVLETALETELTEHLGYEPGDPAGRGSGNSRNGRTKKVHRGRPGRDWCAPGP